MSRFEGYAGNCVPCRKRLWTSRAVAKAAGRRLHPEDQLRPYRCPIDDRYWHIGHLAPMIINGEVSRSQVYRARAA